MPLHGSGWQPQRIQRFVRAFGSALRTALVETEQGAGYLKGLGNPEGPHALACELIGTCLADSLGLPTLDYALIHVGVDDEIPTDEKQRVAPGPAFISRNEELAFTWGGDPETLTHLSNVEVISQLVVTDTWLRNCDRHSPDGTRQNRDNVLLIKEQNSRRAVRLAAMDFTHAFTCGSEFTRKIANIEFVKDERVYGMFPEFRHWMDRRIVQACATKLGEIDAKQVADIIALAPNEWELSKEIRNALATFTVGRAHFLSDHVEQIIWSQMDLLEVRNGN